MIGFGELLFILFIGLGFWIYALVDVIKNEPENSPGNERLVWILVVALGGAIGGLVYWFARRPGRIARLGR